MRIIANESNRAGIVAGILGLSEAVVVSGESMSMVSEAVAGGKPVLVFHAGSGTHFKKKYTQLLRHWESEGKLSLCTAQTLRGALEESFEPHAEGSTAGQEEMDKVLSEAARRVF